MRIANVETTPILFLFSLNDQYMSTTSTEAIIQYHLITSSEFVKRWNDYHYESYDDMPDISERLIDGNIDVSEDYNDMNKILDSGEKRGNISENNDPEDFESIPDTSDEIIIGNIDVFGDYKATDETLTSAEKREDAGDEMKYRLNRMDLVHNVKTGDTL
jgi:hypothetical protein